MIRLSLAFLFFLPYARAAELGLGVNATHFAYSENLTLPEKSRETANYTALAGRLRLDLLSGSYLEGNFETVANVKSQYDGSDMNTNAPVSATDVLGFTHYNGLLNISLFRGFSIYGGYGARLWDRFLSGTPGYREKYSWNYSTFGARIRLTHVPGFDVTFDGSIRPTSGGKIKVITSKTYANGVDSEMALGGKTGYRLALPIHIHLSGLIGFELQPWYEYSEIGESPTVPNSTLAPNPGTGIQEPNSHTSQYGVEVLLTFRI